MLMVIERSCAHDKDKIIIFPSTLEYGCAHTSEHLNRIFIERIVYRNIFRFEKHIIKSFAAFQMIIKPSEKGIFVAVQKPCPL